MWVIYVNMQATRPRLKIICRTKLTGSQTAEGSLFLFRHTEGLYGDFSLEVMEVKKENVTGMAQNLRLVGSKRRSKKNG